jgi:hypothetical protein
MPESALSEEAPQMTDITIPPEALDAAAKAAYLDHVVRSSGGYWPDWDQLDHSVRDGYRSEARAACLAMLKNWPGMVEKRANENLLLANLNPAIILPLTETPNDK